MKFISSAAIVGLVMAGCATNHMMVKRSSNGLDAQAKALTGLGMVKETMDDIQLTLSADTLFKKHSSHLSHDGAASVDAIAAVLLKYPNDQVKVLGYTDNAGTDMKNVAFSQRRANSVKKELVGQGLADANVNATGNGPAEPVAANDSDANKAKNRRIVLDITVSEMPTK